MRRRFGVFGEIRLPTNGLQSGMGLPHSKTLARRIVRRSFREVLECGSPMPLSFVPSGFFCAQMVRTVYK